MLIDGMLKEGWLNVGTEGMLNDGLLTVEPPIEGTIFEGLPMFGVLPGGNPSVGILPVGVCPLGGLNAKARDADTHSRSINRDQLPKSQFPLQRADFVARGRQICTGLLTIAIIG